MNVGTCPVCRIPLSINNIGHKYSIHFCSSCRREFYPMKDEGQKSKQQVEYNDLEPVSKNENAGPVLLSDDSDNRFFPAEYKKKKESYLQKYFPSAKITTREYHQQY